MLEKLGKVQSDGWIETGGAQSQAFTTPKLEKMITPASASAYAKAAETTKRIIELTTKQAKYLSKSTGFGAGGGYSWGDQTVQDLLSQNGIISKYTFGKPLLHLGFFPNIPGSPTKKKETIKNKIPKVEVPVIKPLTDIEWLVSRNPSALKWAVLPGQWIETGGAQSQANSKGENQSVVPSVVNNTYRSYDPYWSLVKWAWKHPFQNAARLDTDKQQKHEEEREKVYALPKEFQAYKQSKIQSDGWIETGGAQSQANSKGENQSRVIPDNAKVEDFLAFEFANLYVHEMNAKIKEMQKVSAPQDLPEWDKADAREKIALEHEHQEHLGILGLMILIRDKKIADQAAMRELIRNNTWIENWLDTASKPIVEDYLVALDARAEAYDEWVYNPDNFSKNTPIEKILGELSLEWLENYNKEHNTFFPIYDHVLDNIGIQRNALTYYVSYADEINRQIIQQIYAKHGATLETLNRLNNDRFKEAIETPATYSPEMELAITSAAEKAAKRLVIDGDSHEVDTIVDAATNYAVRNGIIWQHSLIQGILDPTKHTWLSRRARAADLYIHLGGSKIFEKKGMMGAIHQAQREDYVAELLTGNKNSDLSEITAEEWYAFMYDQLWKNTGIPPEEAMKIITEFEQNGGFHTDIFLQDIKQLWVDKFIDPLALGRVDIALTNVLYSIGEVMDLSSYSIKYDVAGIKPELFGEGKTTRDVQVGMYAPTFSESGRVNPDYDTGNFISNLLLEIFSDFTTWLNLGAGISRAVTAGSLVKKIGSYLDDAVFWKNAPHLQDDLIAYLTKPAFGFSRPGATTVAKQIAKGKTVEQAILAALTARKGVPETLRQITKDQLNELFKTIKQIKGTEFSMNLIQLFKGIDAFADGVDQALLFSALIFSGPGIPILAARSVPAFITIGEILRARLYKAWLTRKEKLVKLADFADYAKAQHALQETLPAAVRTDLGKELLAQLKAVMSFDMYQLKRIKAKFDKGGESLEDVLKELKEFILSKNPGLIEKDVITPDVIEEAFDNYMRAVRAQFQDIIKAGVPPKQVEQLLHAVEGNLSEFKALLNEYSRVHKAVTKLEIMLNKRMDLITGQLDSIEKSRKQLIKDLLSGVASEKYQKTIEENLTNLILHSLDDSLKISVESLTKIAEQLLEAMLEAIGEGTIVSFRTADGVLLRGTLLQALDSLQDISPQKLILDQGLQELIPVGEDISQAKIALKEIIGDQMSNFLTQTHADINFLLEQENAIRALDGRKLITTGDIRIKKIKPLIQKRIDELYKNIPTDLVNKYLEPMYDYIEVIRLGKITEIYNLSKTIDIDPLIKESKNTLEMLFKDVSKNKMYQELIQIEKAQATRAVQHDFINKLLKHRADQLSMAPGASAKIKRLQNRANKIMDKFEKITKVSLSADKRESFMSIIQQVAEDFQKIERTVQKYGKTKQVTTTLKHSMEQFFNSLDNFLKHLEELNADPSAYMDIMKERVALLHQLDSLRAIHDKILGEIYDEHIKSISKIKIIDGPHIKESSTGHAFIMYNTKAATPEEDFKLIEEMLRKDYAGNPNLENIISKQRETYLARYSPFELSGEGVMIGPQPIKEPIKGNPSIDYDRIAEVLRQEGVPEKEIKQIITQQQQEYAAHFQKNFEQNKRYSTSYVHGPVTQVQTEIADFIIYDIASEAADNISIIEKSLLADGMDPDLVKKAVQRLQEQQHTKQKYIINVTGLGTPFEKKEIYEKATLLSNVSDSSNILHNFLVDMNNFLQHRDFDLLVKEKKVIAFKDAIYRLKKENLFSHVSLNYSTGWMDIVDILLYREIDDNISLLQRIIEDANFVIKFPNASPERIQALAAEIYHYAVVSRHTHDMEQEMITMLSELGPVKLFTSDVEAADITHAFLSNLQQLAVKTENLSLEEMYYQSAKLVDELADKAETYLSSSNKFPKVKLDTFRNNTKFKTWFKKSKYQEMYDLAFTQAHTGEGDTLLGIALFDYLSDPVNAKKHFPLPFELELPIDRRNTWYWDLETTSVDPGTAGVTSITVRNLDDPTKMFSVYVRNPVEPLPPAVAELTFGSKANYDKIIATAPNVVENERIAFQQMYEFIRDNSTTSMDHVRLMAHNGDKFDSRIGARFLPSQHSFFNSKNNIDTYRMMQKAGGWFEYGVEVRNNLKHIFRRYVEKLYNARNLSSLESKFIMGANPDLANRIREFVELLEQADLKYLIAANGYDNFAKQLQYVANQITAEAGFIATENKWFIPTFISKAEIEEFGGINAVLKDADINKMYSTKMVYDSRRAAVFFEGYGRAKLTATEAPLLGRIVYYADESAKKIHPNEFFKNYDFASVIRYLKEQGSKDNAINRFLQYLRVENTPSNHFAILQQLVYWDPQLKKLLPAELLSALEDATLFYTELPITFFDNLMKNIGRPQEILDAYDILKEDVFDPLRIFAQRADIANRYLFSPEMRVQGAGILEARELVNQAMQKYSEIPHFAEIEKQLHDRVMSAYLKELFAIPVENGQLTETGLEKFISHMLYNARSPVIRISVNDLFVNAEFDEFVRLLRANPELLEKYGIGFYQDSFALYIGLTEVPGKNITQDLSKFTYKGRTVERPEFYGNFFSEFDMASSGLDELGTYAQQINKVNENLLRGTEHNYFQKAVVYDPTTNKYKGQWYQMSQGHGAMKEVINTDEMEQIFTGMLPAEVQEMFPDPVHFLGDDFHSGITFNHFNLGSFESRKVLQPMLPTSYSKRLAISAKRVQEFGEAKYKMLSMFTETDATLHLGFEGKISEAFKRMFGITDTPTRAQLIEIQEYLKSHPEFTIAAVVQDKKMGFRLIQIRPNNPKLIEEAIRLNAIVVENNIFAYMFNKINYNNIGEKAPLLARLFQEGSKMYMILSKLGWLSRSATVLNNVVDNAIKSSLDSGENIITTAMYQASATVEYMRYSNILRHLDTSGLSFDDAVTVYFKHTAKPAMDELRFREIHTLLNTYAFSGHSFADQLKFAQAAKGTEKIKMDLQVALSVGFAPISMPEQIAKLAHYNALTTQGVGTHEALHRIVATFFDYTKTTHGAVDFLFPFYNFMINNLIYWMQKMETNPAFFRLLSDYAPLVMDESQMTAVDVIESPQRNWARALLYLPMSLFTDGALSGSYFALNSSFMDVFKFGVNPLQFFEDNLFEGSRQLVNTMKYSVNNPELVHAGNLAELWTAAQQTYSGYSFLLGDRIAVHPDEVTEMSQVWSNFQKLIPFYGSIMGTLDRGRRIYDRTGQFFIPSLLFTPYHARIIDNYPLDTKKKIMREYQYLDAQDNVIARDYVFLEQDPDKEKKETVFNPAQPIEIKKTPIGTKYQIMDMHTGKPIYTAIYPTQSAGEFFQTDNVDGTRTSYFRDYKGDVTWSRTTEATTTYHDFSNNTRVRDVKTGMLTGMYVTLPGSTYTYEEIDASGRRVQRKYNAKGNLIGITRIEEKVNGTQYVYYDSNGIYQNMYFYKHEDLKFEEKELGNGRYALIAYNKNGYMQFVQYYTKTSLQIGGVTLNVKHYENVDFKDVHYQYQYYNDQTGERITYNQAMGTLKNGSVARKIETYDPKTKTIKVVSYNKFNNIIKTEIKSVKFNYLNYKPGSYSRTYKQSFYDPYTGVLQTNYVDSNGKIKYYKKIIPTEMGKIYEYYDANGNLTSQTFYSSEPRSLREVKSFDIENNIKIFSYYNDANELQYTKKIISDFNPNHLGKIYEYYDAYGNLTKRTFYASVPETQDPVPAGQESWINSMEELERLQYEHSIAIQEREKYLDTKLGSDEPEYIEDEEEHLEQLNAQIATLSAQLSRFPTEQKKVSTQTAHTDQRKVISKSKYSSSARQYSRIQDAASQPNKASLLVSRIRGMVNQQSPMNIYAPKDMNGLYFTTPSFYKKLYTLEGNSRIMQNVNTVLQRHQHQRMVRKMMWRYR